jgi:hypothetical protein
MNTMKPINALGVLIAALAVAAFVDPHRPTGKISGFGM